MFTFVIEMLLWISIIKYYVAEEQNHLKYLQHLLPTIDGKIQGNLINS